MLKDLLIKEIKDLKINYANNDCRPIKVINKLSHIVITQKDDSMAVLQGFLDVMSKEILCFEKDRLYKIHGTVVVEDLKTNKTYEGDFEANNVFIYDEMCNSLSMRLLKLNSDDVLYKMTFPTEKIEIDRNTKECSEYLTDLINELFDTLSDKPRLETWRLIKELMEFQTDYRNKYKSKDEIKEKYISKEEVLSSMPCYKRKIKNATIFYDDGSESRITSIGELKNIVKNL